jgi:hypothetical protein
VDVVILLVFVSLVLVVGALIFFLTRLRDGDFDHGERLSLLPLAEDENQATAVPTNPLTSEVPDKNDVSLTIDRSVKRGDKSATGEEEGPPHGSYS